MKRVEFDKLRIEEQVIEFNKMYETHKSIRKVCAEIEIGKSTIKDRFSKIGYSSVEGVGYIKNTNIPIKAEASIIEPVNANKDYIEPNKIKTEPKHDGLEKFIEQKINEMLDKRLNKPEEQLSNSKFTNKIVISSRCDGESVGRSFEVYTKIRDEFIEFCKTQPYTLKELVSQAFIEFMENHK
jgi:hypothetical protein